MILYDSENVTYYKSSSLKGTNTPKNKSSRWKNFKNETQLCNSVFDIQYI